MREGRKLGETVRAALAAAALALGPQAEAQTKAGWKPKVEAAAQKMPASARTYGDAVPPRDFPNYCARHPEECAPYLGTPRERMLREAGGEFQRLQLKETDADVNALPQVSDLELYGTKELWTIAGHRGGDCEDLAILKQKLLHGVRGMKRNNLLLTHVLTKEGEGHIVLMVRLYEGDYVLDNRKQEVAPWSTYVTKHGYTFLSRQSYLDPKVWVSLLPK